MEKLKKYTATFLLAFVCVCLIFCFYFNKFYPIKYDAEIEYASKSFNVEKKLIYSVIKAESGFDEKAKSNANAIGLMQLLENTAIFIADEIGFKGDIDLTNPSINIYLGTAYLNYLSNKFQTLRAVLCAYNAGEGTVMYWLYEDKDLKNIPYYETERYVKKVENNMRIYAIKLK